MGVLHHALQVVQQHVIGAADADADPPEERAHVLPAWYGDPVGDFTVRHVDMCNVLRNEIDFVVQLGGDQVQQQRHYVEKHD